MKKTAIVLAAFAAAASASAASAQDNSAFTGPRVEAVLGYDITRAGSSIDNDNDDGRHQSIDGLLYGGGVGYDIAFRGAVIGVEGEYTASTAKTNFSDGRLENFGLGRVQTGRDLYIGARAGILATPSTLVYVKGGYTNARYKVLATNLQTELNQRIDTDGWRIGAGAEVAIRENAYAKLEYRYSNYSKGEIDYRNSNVPDSQRFDVDLDRHQVVAAVGLRF